MLYSMSLPAEIMREDNMDSDDQSYLLSLNEAQRKAVETTEGPVLVLAGAGTGKTRVLITRLGHILAQGLARPYQILAVTFTNKAAVEMRERVSDLVSGNSEGLWLGTFHSLSMRILRRHSSLLGFQGDFTVLDTDDQVRLIKQIMKAQQVDEKRNPPKLIAGIISRWKDRALTPEKVTAAESKGNRLALEIYKEYQERLKVLNAMDFGDLLLHCLTIFERHPDVLESYQHQFQYILVDEYQDTNVAQYLWLRLLSMGSGNICCVGDEDQSIYAWRGAEIGNILRFEHDFPGATIIRLEQNYRSTGHILGAASGLILHNKGRFGKTLWTQSQTGEKITVRATQDGADEAKFVCHQVATYQQRGESLSEMAILVRASSQTREFEDRLLKIGIPYRVIGGLRFYERQEIRDAIAYLRLISQPEDGLAFERIINVPRRGIGTTTIQNIHQEARAVQVSVSRMARHMAQENLLKGSAKTGIKNFFFDIDRWREMAKKVDLSQLMEIILDESGYTQMWKDDKSPDAPGRLENLKELVSALKQFKTLTEFLEHISLVMEATSQQNGDMISLMTLHGAKGLEFNIVFLPAWEEGIFPNGRSLQESSQEGLEEERRLAYVGITRARKKAIISYAYNRRTFQGWQHSRYSRFIDELPQQHLQVINMAGRETTLQKRDDRSFDLDFDMGGDDNVFAQDEPMPSSFSTKRRSISDAIFTVERKHSFQVDDAVFHKILGRGIITAIDGDTLVIDFGSKGVKTIMYNFVVKV